MENIHLSTGPDNLSQDNATLETKTNKPAEGGANALLKMALDYFPLGITIKDVNGEIIYTNFTEAEIHGYKVEEIIHKEASVLAPRKLWKPLTVAEIENLGHWIRESLNISKDGKEFPVQLSSNIIRNEKGMPLGIVTTCEDITKRKQLEESLEKSKKELKKRVKELEEFYDMAIGRELRNKQLRKENEDLKAELKKYKNQEMPRQD